MLCSLKYTGRLQWARTAAGLIVDCVLQQDLDLPQLLLPVPVTHKAIHQRGFIQSVYIARLVGQQLKIKVGFDVVHKPAKPTASPRSREASANKTLPAPMPLPDPSRETGSQSLTM